MCVSYSVIQNTPTHGNTTQTNNEPKPRLTDGLCHPIPLFLSLFLPLCDILEVTSLSPMVSSLLHHPSILFFSLLLAPSCPPSLSACLISMFLSTLLYFFTPTRQFCFYVMFTPATFLVWKKKEKKPFIYSSYILFLPLIPLKLFLFFLYCSIF